MSIVERETPRRWYTADWLALVERMVTRHPTEPSATVELTRNARGEVQFSVKVYASASSEAADVETATARAYDQATQAFDSLGTVYPFTPPPPKEK